jgi:hypothetical protein
MAPSPSAKTSLFTLTLAALLATPGVVSAPTIPGIVHALGTASSVAIQATALALEGGAADWDLVCADCLVLVTITQPDQFVVAQSGTVQTTLPPGPYEVRGFAGLFAYTFQHPHEIFVEMHGVGRVLQR